MEVQVRIKEFLEKRPDTISVYSSNIRHDEYGSTTKNEVELILVVEDAKKWHLENMINNPGDYSLIGKLFYTSASKERIRGFTGISYQRNIREKKEYLSLVNKGVIGLEPEYKLEQNLFSYGVVEFHDLERQLCSWNCISLANIFQKDTVSLKTINAVDELVNYNRKNLLLTALLFLEEESTLTDLYKIILKLIGTDINEYQQENIREKLDRLYGRTNEFYEVFYGENIIINRKMVETYFLPAYLEASLEGISKNDLAKRKKVIIDFFKQKSKEEKYYQLIHDIRTSGVIRSTEYAFQKLKKRCTKNN